MLPRIGTLVTLYCFVTMVIGQLTWELLQNRSSKLQNGNIKVPLPCRDMAFGYFPEKHQLILFGGKSPPRELPEDTWIYDLTKGKWRLVTASKDKPPARFSMVYGVSGEYFYIATGQGKAGNFYSDIWRFSIITEQWKELETSMALEGRFGAAGGIFPGSHKFIVVQGFSNYRLSNTYVLDLISQNWTEVFPERHPYNPSYPHARCLHSGTMLDNNTLVIFGGCLSGGGTGGPCPSGDSWTFFLHNQQWTQLNNCATQRQYSALALLQSSSNDDHLVLLYGGEESSSQILSSEFTPPDEVAILDTKSLKWQLKLTQGKVPSKRFGMAMATGKNGIYMFGGESSSGLLNDLWFLDGTVEQAFSAPDSRSCLSFTFNLIYLHGIFMILGWGVFLQIGALLARYMRECDPLWFQLHRSFQVIGLLLAFAGLICGIVSVQSSHFKFLHGIVGLVIMFQGLQQVINAVIRPQKPPVGYPIAIWRRIWEFFHKVIGRVTLILAIINICLGIFLGMTHYLVWVVWYTYLFILIIVYMGLEIKKCIEERSLYRRRRRLSASNEMW